MGTQLPQGAQPLPILANFCCGPKAGWIKMPNATWYGGRPQPRPRVRRGTQLDSPTEIDTTAPNFSAHVYCGHGRPSQQLQSSRELRSQDQGQAQLAKFVGGFRRQFERTSVACRSRPAVGKWSVSRSGPIECRFQILCRLCIKFAWFLGDRL